MQIDVFNGDADGICALIQLRLAKPANAKLVTGIKRDIELLEKVSATTGDQITVLDISLEKNQSALSKLLDQGVEIFYVDHHKSGEIPDHSALTTIIDISPYTCTSLLINQYLQGRYPLWALTAAFGDNINRQAAQLAAEIGLSSAKTEQLKELGICINYNGYGSSIEDLHFPPDKLFFEMASFDSPFDFITENAGIYEKLVNGYHDDLRKARDIKPEYKTKNTALYLLPDQIWSRRISGVFGNELANQHPERAHAIVSYNKAGEYLISVRAPLTKQTGADDLCSAFPSGGGRKAAAGINHLTKKELPNFIKAFDKQFQQI